MGALQSLEAFDMQLEERKKSQKKGAYVYRYQNQKKKCENMIDTSATHNFITNTKARQLGLAIEKDQRKLKIVNLKALTTSKMAKLVQRKVGQWNGNISFTVAPLDDFNMVLELKFLMEA